MFCSHGKAVCGCLSTPACSIDRREAWRLQADSRKIVAGNQLKSVIGEVMPYKVTTKDGKPIHLKFGAKSMAARIVMSFKLMGTYGAILDSLTEQVVAEYERA